ncbi:MAG: N-acetyltransferase [Lachnospiraceae bacterium]|nr:N-acetyltransferase [Lachnospiraceae bacterium]
MKKLVIRNETESDYTIVENITRNAFWNLYVPGCDEHYLVHIMRNHEDFIPELAFVAELDGQVIGNVMYTKSKLIDKSGEEKQILTFGPICILPEYQREGYGKAILEHSFQRALELGYDVIVIFGNPGNYVSRGFKSCKKYNVCLENDSYPSAMLVKELKVGVLDGRKWRFQDSSLYQIDSAKVQSFDEQFEPKEKMYKPSQEEFYIHSNSVIH